MIKIWFEYTNSIRFLILYLLTLRWMEGILCWWTGTGHPYFNQCNTKRKNFKKGENFLIKLVINEAWHYTFLGIWFHRGTCWGDGGSPDLCVIYHHLIRPGPYRIWPCCHSFYRPAVISYDAWAVILMSVM